MLASAALGRSKDNPYTPEDLYRDFPDIDKYRDGYGGFGDGLFRDKKIMEKLNLKLENENGRPYYEGKAWGEGLLMDSLEDGKRAIWCTQNKIFTDSGHYIELELKDGKIWLNDPNGANYKSMDPTLKNILENGCTPEQFKKYGGRFYIFDVANSEANAPTGEKSNEVLMDEILKKGSPTPTTSPRTRTTTSSNNTNDATINPKWKSGYLDYSKGILDWNDGQNQIRETWCNYDVRTSDALKFTILALGKDEGYWVREDSAQMFGDKVCIASDIGAWFGSKEGAIFKVGDTCESSFGTGIVMDLCGESVEARKENRTNSAGQKIDLWFDIYAMPYADASTQSKSYNDSNKYYQSNAGWEDFFRRYPSMKPDTPEPVTDWAKYFKDPEGYFKNSNNTAAKTTSTTPTTPTTPTTSTRTITGTRKDFNEVDAVATLDELATRHGVNTAAKTEREILLEIAGKYGIDTNLATKNNDAIIEAILPKISGKTEIALWNSLKSNKKESESEWVWPTDIHNISSDFGKRSTGIEGATTNHKGIDIEAYSTNNIYAANGGTVIFAGWYDTGGNTIMIDHGNGYVTQYSHCDSMDVKVGEKVEKGQMIGHPGNTRNKEKIPVMSQHLHFAVKYNGENIDPESLYSNDKSTQPIAPKETSTTPEKPTTPTTPNTTTNISSTRTRTTKPANATPKTTIGTRTIEQEVNKQNDGDLTNIQPKNNSDIAHRGYTPGGIYDNSAEGFRLAGEKGFWGCETDVRFDADGNLVCSHNAVKNGQNPTSFEEYLDICKEYGMTAIIDLKYEKGVGPADAKLSPTILETIQKKGMMDSCILQTNNPTDIPYIRENSEDARIWYLTDVVSDNNINLINENNVECVNILSSENNAYRIKKLTENGTDVCVWNVQTETSKDKVLNMGAKYVMSDNVLGITPYQEGEEDFNEVNSNLEKDSTKKATTDAEPAPKQTTQTVTQTRIPTRVPTTPTVPETPATPIKPETPAKPTKPAMPETPTKPETPTTPSIPDISEPEDTKLPVMQCTPEAILKAAQNIENTENNSIYICNILYLSGYFTEEEMNMYKNLDISTIFKQIEERGWDKITNTSNLKIGDIIIIDNGEEIRVYAGNNSWYTAGKTEIQKGNENWAEGIEWLAYRPD